MNTNTRWFALVLSLCFLGGAALLEAQTGLKNLNDGAQALAETLMEAAPHSAGQGLTWSDAWIGHLISVRPHFGVGASMGAAVPNQGAYSDFTKSMALEGGDFFVLPAMFAEIRLGGVVLPFDLGFKFGLYKEFKPDNILLEHSVSKNFLSYGGDIRFALSKGLGAFPKLSIGVGYNYLKGGMNAGLDGIRNYDISGKTLTVNGGTLDYEWEANIIELKLQFSKTLSIFTPYLGAASNFSWAASNYRIGDSTVSYTGGMTSIDADLAGAGISGLAVTNNGLSAEFEKRGIGTRVFGGCSFNLFVFRLDLSGFCSFPGLTWGGTLGFRIQT
ncbi:MAG: hypothetical protein LBC77_04640 [Spirochaetaceae bacterium]|jgi:hypothetical protein|nr:hypothetical protein [Spirochaetaceae bacterium]